MEQSVRGREVEVKRSVLETKNSLLGLLRGVGQKVERSQTAVSDRMGEVFKAVNEGMDSWWNNRQAAKDQATQRKEAEWVKRLKQYEALKLKEAGGHELEIEETATIRDTETAISLGKARGFALESLAGAQDALADMGKMVGQIGDTFTDKKTALKYLIALAIASSLAAACKGPDQKPTATVAKYPIVTHVAMATEKPTELPPTSTAVPTKIVIPATATKEPTPTETALPSENFGPVEITGEELKLIHIQNRTSFLGQDTQGTMIGDMISADVFTAREKILLDIRQRTIDKLAAETGTKAPENTFDAYFTWLKVLKNSGKIDKTKYWSYASNMILTVKEIKVLVENQTPERSIEVAPEELRAGLDHSHTQTFTIKQPDGTEIANKVPTAIQGGVLAVVPIDLIPGEYNTVTGKSYVILGDDAGNPMTIVGITQKSFGNMQYGGLADYSFAIQGVAGMEEYKILSKRWWGYTFLGQWSAGSPIYRKSNNYANIGQAQFSIGSFIDTMNVAPTARTWFRFYWLLGTGGLGPLFSLDANGVILPDALGGFAER